MNQGERHKVEQGQRFLESRMRKTRCEIKGENVQRQDGDVAVDVRVMRYVVRTLISMTI